jgi:hypothetical protein
LELHADRYIKRPHVLAWADTLAARYFRARCCFDLNNQGPVTTSHLRLLVDANDNGIFADDTPIAGAVSLGGNLYRFSGVSALVNDRRFTLSTTNIGSTPLPVELLYFNAEVNMDRTVDLSWTTGSERNNAGFVVQRSANASDWTDVLQRNGIGTGSTTTSYVDLDASPLPGHSYYRLKQIDHDGTPSYAPVVHVYLEEELDILVFPVPARDELSITQGPTSSIVSVSLINGLGQVAPVPLQRAADRMVLDVASLPVVAYVLMIIGMETTQQHRVIIAR